jgi:hypothetical protein
MWYEHLKHWFLAAVVLGLLAAGAWYGYYDYLKKDGVPCERDVHCPERVCIPDRAGLYCSRHCATDGDCLSGWRCVRPPGTTGRRPSCVRPPTY